jgi:hypothetical protein
MYYLIPLSIVLTCLVGPLASSLLMRVLKLGILPWGNYEMMMEIVHIYIREEMK